MQTLMVDFIISLDGYGAATDWPGLWGLGGPEYFAFLGEQEEHTVLLGATTYRLMSGFAADGAGMAELDAMRKVVFSSTLQEPLTWDNTDLVATDAVEHVREMKRTSDLPVRTLGSISLCRSLLTAGLVDRFRVVIFPVITGANGYDRIFDEYPGVRLELLDHRVMDGRLQLLEYAPTVMDAPPGSDAPMSS
ncbi:dihydrofolate reductase family protein [Luteipulveratus halotolerans]|uniref:Deaminase/reductase n=1 Tax=Luteipulveratus halotolerans TaxID=1631356 RepID=A0A0L6CLI7_9MICO|nr:dihydrofolate reductase family protein [Luteipulveratus halotolerans]KNX38671.1 deaminase/reductase [Luteipulveratus halotolerans]